MRSPLTLVVAALIVLVFVPQLHNGYWENLARSALMFATLALGWNIIGGFTGYVSFGNVVYFGLGAYVSALLSQYFNQQSVFVAIPIACVVCAVVAVVLGLPILRLKGHYFGIATLGIALAASELIANSDYLGGGSGFTLQQAAFFAQYYYAMWGVCVISLLATWSISRSKLGYALVAIRENEEAATALGVNPTYFKIVAWAISAMMAGAAGAVYAFATGFVDPPSVFSIDFNVFPIVMTIIGGAGTVAGPAAGAFLLTAINETLWSHYPQVHTLFFGAIIVLVVLFAPRGVLTLLRLRGGWRGFVREFGAYRV
jgi:branched-chain amino acid transport system permease protein